jgi:[ribosomal protein S18]-alanine N-acetyltransferase
VGVGARPSAGGGLTPFMTRIVAATATDLPAVLAIEREVFSDPWSAASFRDALDQPAIYFACALSDADEVAGYVVAWFVADQGEIGNLAVSPNGWGTGIGRALLDAALAEGDRRGAVAVYLEVRISNARARRLYGSRGFEEVGRRRGYYRHPDEDAIVLRRTR